jgi:uncharacterized protein
VRRAFWLGVGLGGAAAGGALLVLSAYMAHVITRPRRSQPAAAREVAAELEDVTFRTSDGLTLHGWYWPTPQARAALVVAHGFGMTRVELLELARGLRSCGYAILLFDFRAHGASEGRRSTMGFQEAEDIVAGVHFLLGRPDLRGCSIGVLGISMGGAAALLATAREPAIGAVVADSAFATLHEVAAGGLRALYRLPPFPFAPLIVRFGEALTGHRIAANRPVDAVAAIAPRPLLLIHGVQDRLIPLSNAQALYAAASAPRELWVVPDVGHASAHHQMPDEYLARVDTFFGRALAPASP